MRVVIPPGQSWSALSLDVALTPTEAHEPPGAPDRDLATGIALCHFSVQWDGFETDVSLTLESIGDFPEP